MAGSPIAGGAPRGVETAALTLLAMIAFAVLDGIALVLSGRERRRHS